MLILYRSGNLTQTAREMTKRDIDIVSIGELHWTEQGRDQLAEGATIIYCGKDDENHEVTVRIR